MGDEETATRKPMVRRTDGGDLEGSPLDPAELDEAIGQRSGLGESVPELVGLRLPNGNFPVMRDTYFDLFETVVHAGEPTLIIGHRIVCTEGELGWLYYVVAPDSACRSIDGSWVDEASLCSLEAQIEKLNAHK